MSQQGLRQASIRAVTSTALTHQGDWLALFDSLEIPAGTFNERLLSYVNAKLGTTYDNVNGAMAALAADQSANEFQGMGTFTPSIGPGGSSDVVLLVNGTDGLLLVDGSSFLKLASSS